MNSRDLTQLGFSGWATFNKSYKGLVLENLPALPGVYAISGPGTSRQIGFSDVLYVGCAANQDGLRLRVRQAVYVLHAFQKKSRRAFATPKCDLDLIGTRLIRAKEDYEAWLKSR